MQTSVERIASSYAPTRRQLASTVRHLKMPEMKSRPKKPVTSRQEPKIKPRTVIDLKATNAMDRILDKVREKGLHSLTEKEKKLLMEISREQQGGES